MDETQTTASPTQTEETPTALAPKEEKKPEGIEHDPYEWGKCAVTANIVWLPDGSVMVGARNHLDAPVIRLLAGDELACLPGHAAELPIPTSEAIADLLAQLREELPLRAQAKAERDKAAEARQKPATSKKNAKPAPTAAPIPPTPASTVPASAPAGNVPLAGKVPLVGKLPPVGKAPAGNQIAMFNFFTGGN